MFNGPNNSVHHNVKYLGDEAFESNNANLTYPTMCRVTTIDEEN